MSSATKHLDAVGTIEDLGTVDNLPESRNPFGAGRQRQYNPFDELVKETYQTGKPRLAVADSLSSARVLIRRAAEHSGLGIDIVQTVAADGRPALAYLAREKRAKAPNATSSTANTSAPASSTPPAPQQPEQQQQQPYEQQQQPQTPAPVTSSPAPVPSPAFDDQG